jgi:hypothetical protein
MKANTGSRRHMPAAAAVTMTPTAALAANENHGSHLGGNSTLVEMAADPVLVAIERHRKAAQALSAAHEPSDALLNQLCGAEQDAFLVWLTTPLSTIAGIIATLEHAAVKYSDGFDNYANLAESAQYCRGDGDSDPDDVVTAGERFPAMIATALRKIAGSPRMLGRVMACTAKRNPSLPSGEGSYVEK